ncbi:hypothetical protein [Enterococcus casseliflavus]|uniref:hypothetical protein n=1 Tax=Enterococcus casseliflavus TaxID=37734 RepID=UPI0022E3BD8D|nr:hypothetical protein [Enterococcus casseliflavus]
MSFPAIKFKEFALEEWEESEIYQYFSEKRFLFVVYRHDGTEYKLDKAMFWNMPMTDLEGIGKEEWLANQKVVKEGVELIPKGNRVLNNLPKAKDTKIFHLRPHASKSVYEINGQVFGNSILHRDSDELPNGDRMVKQCFWLNNKYLERIINS